MIEWRPIAEFPAYEVSNTGIVRGKRGELKLRSDRKGYLFANLRDGKLHKRAVARLVAEAFNGPRPVGCITRHRDGIKTNNIPSNLLYGTPTQNERDKRDHGTAPIGTRHPSAKLTEAQVVEIRRRYQPHHKDRGARAMGHKFGVAADTIQKIIARRIWAHLPRQIVSGDL